MFIRGSVVRYVVLPRSEVDVGLLEDATRRGEFLSLSAFSLAFDHCAAIRDGRWEGTGVVVVVVVDYSILEMSY